MKENTGQTRQKYIFRNIKRIQNSVMNSNTARTGRKKIRILWLWKSVNLAVTTCRDEKLCVQVLRLRENRKKQMKTTPTRT